MESYLMDKLDFYGSSLTFRALANVLPLDGRLRSWVIGNDAHYVKMAWKTSSTLCFLVIH